ncbi:MAG TPA: ribonuclease H [Candidatus Binataceae bacterium]|jgi:ribonuclease HI|nr:ribonuclease H [Candidatus Binataceae bacterium]
MPATSSAPILVYADGSCEGNPGPGGWGVVIVTPNGTRRLSGADPQTTNNRMEISAAIEALRALDPGVPVIVRSDSQYVVRTMNDGWRRTKNQDLWQELDREAARHDVRFEWVRGHAGDALNEEADALAREAARSAAKGRDPRRSGAVGAPAGAAQAAPVGAPAGAPSAAEASAAERTAGPGRPIRAAGGTAGAGGAAPAAPPDPYDDELDQLIYEKLRPMLEEGERIARCDVCKQHFVARGDETCCSLAGCQMQKRC